MPEGMHPLPDLPGKGWSGAPFVDPDGQNWPLSFASQMLDIPQRKLEKLVRDAEIQPAGVIRMASFRRQGRAPRAYPASELIKISEAYQPKRKPASPSPE